MNTGHISSGVVDGYESDPDGALAALSAAYWPERLASGTALLLLHGAADDRVPVSSSLTMAAHLAQLQHPFRLAVLEQGSHTLIEHQLTVRKELDHWFVVHLKHAPDNRTISALNEEK